ncbi:NAD-dependent epimerase/dehydratase family protein [Dactylosporangium sp. CA-092794]|uniref:NAD-dependent epimerase/dehydratase family protein n=1 Tax=Dactylosporangium sp. CA-092794 TaxID=3239929 RepID=UPI003D924D94
MKALIIGGTGPTGPFIVQGLVDRGYTPVILHRGNHEVDFVAGFEHLHADPHFADPVREAIAGRRFDVVVAAYGRLRLLVDLLAGHTDRLITIGGTVYERQRWSAPADESAGRDVSHALVAKVQQTEDAILARHHDGTFNLTHLRYPNLYGPRQLAPREWSVVRRILDGRRTVPVLDGGLTLESRAYVENAAQAVLLAVDAPEASAGRIYHVADLVTPSDGERAQAIAAAMGVEIELVNYPRGAGLPGYFWGGGRNLEAMGRPGPPPTHHKLLDSGRIRAELGYVDAVGFQEAIRRTVAYYVANPLDYGGEEEARIGDPFDYAAEDAFAQALSEFVDRCHHIPFAGVTLRHSYDHPKTAAGTPPAT